MHQSTNILLWLPQLIPPIPPIHILSLLLPIIVPQSILVPISLAKTSLSPIRKADIALGLVIPTDNMLGRIPSTDITLGPDSKSLTKWGLSCLRRQEEVQTGC
jgi:hypothetical protein